MEPRRGRLVRPLLRATRDDTRAYCEERGLAWREDVSNLDPRFARTRVRHEVLPVLRDLNPAAERNIADTAALLRDEAEVLERAADEALGSRAVGGVELSELRAHPPGLARLMLRRLAEAATGGSRSISRDDADRILDLGRAGGSAALDLGDGLRAVAEYGTLRFTVDPDAAAPDPVLLTVPGSARFGPWEVAASIGPGGEVELAASELGPSVTVRSWQHGDRMRPAGLGGTKTLQDLFTDRKVPRAMRAGLPVVEAGGEIAWVAGVAVGERFRPAGDEADVVSLSAWRAVG
jgi:tRNA(Ile)-lysidine synthase